MIDFSKEIDEILEDPLFADVTAPKRRATSSDRLIAGFQEVLDFYETNGNLPDENTDSRLYRYLKGILAKEDKIERCRPFDMLGILAQKEVAKEPEIEYVAKPLSPEEELEQLLYDPLLDDITDGGDLGLFDVPDYMKERLAARREAEYVGRRRPCEDFAEFEAGFKERHAGLKSGKYKLIKFEEPHVKPGQYVIEQGTMVYIASTEDIKKNRFGRRDGRIRCIYENGSESDILKLTLCKNIYTNGGYSIIENSDEASNGNDAFDVKKEDHDVESGTIYVLRSKSSRPEIASIKNLYKIGFTVNDVETRIANAKNEPTYLCADVEIYATWKVYNVKSSTFESLIHKLFDGVRLQVTIDGHRPKEWFIVPFKIIEQAVTNIIHTVPMIYEPQFEQLVILSNSEFKNV